MPNLALGLETAMVDGITKALPNFIQKRAAVSNVATGNWHITIGNPMNPIMRYGNLVVSTVTCDFNDELGADDFPTEMTYTVTLLPMQPRDGRGIRRIFNIGKRDYVDSFGGVTTDQVNTYGANTKRMMDLSNGAKNEATNLTKSGDPNSRANSPGNNGATGSSSVNGDTEKRIKDWIINKYGDPANVGRILTTGTEQRLKAIYFYRPDLTAEGVGFTRSYVEKGK
jgi:hypothetical protein